MSFLRVCVLKFEFEVFGDFFLGCDFLNFWGFFLRFEFEVFSYLFLGYKVFDFF